jgi:hypothetical protein
MSDNPHAARPEELRERPEPAPAASTDDVGHRARDLRGTRADAHVAAVSDPGRGAAATQAQVERADAARSAPDPLEGRELALGIAHPGLRADALADVARNAGDPRTGRDIALHIDDPDLRARTLADVARNAEDPRIGRDIANTIGTDVRDAAGTTVRDRGLADVAGTTDDPLIGRDIALHIDDPDLRARILADVARNAGDPLTARDIVSGIDAGVTDATGMPIRDLTLADIANRTPDPQLAGDVANGIADDRLRTTVLAAIDDRDTGP